MGATLGFFIFLSPDVITAVWLRTAVFWDMIQQHNTGQNPSGIWCSISQGTVCLARSIITWKDANLKLIFVNRTNTVISTKIWLLQTLKSVSTGLGQVLHPFLSPFHICNQSNFLKPSHITGTICLLQHYTIYPTWVTLKQKQYGPLLKKNKAHYVV